MEHFADNLDRLMGMHRVTAKELAQWLNMSQSTFAKWQKGTRSPAFPSALTIADFFGVRADDLSRAPFEDLLAGDLSDPERFRKVEEAIRARRSTLKVAKTANKPRTVVPMSEGR